MADTVLTGTIIETARLRLRMHHDGDLSDLVGLAAPWNIAGWLTALPYPYTDVHGRDWIAHVRQLHAAGQPRAFATALKDTDRLIGGVGLDGISGTGADEPSLGYWVGRPYQGRGYAREAAAAVIDYGFRSLGLNIIHGVTDPENVASQKVLLACGLWLVGNVDLPQPTRRGARRATLFRISWRDYLAFVPV